MQNKVLLSWVIQHLSKTAADANDRLCRDYISAAGKLAESNEISIVADFIPLPPPLVITGMKMKFSANISRSDSSLGGDMMLEFGKTPNFHGEIELTPFGPKQIEIRQSDVEQYAIEQYEHVNDEELLAGLPEENYLLEESSESLEDSKDISTSSDDAVNDVNGLGEQT